MAGIGNVRRIDDSGMGPLPRRKRKGFVDDSGMAPALPAGTGKTGPTRRIDDSGMFPRPRPTPNYGPKNRGILDKGMPPRPLTTTGPKNSGYIDDSGMAPAPAPTPATTTLAAPTTTTVGGIGGATKSTSTALIGREPDIGSVDDGYGTLPREPSAPYQGDPTPASPTPTSPTPTAPAPSQPQPLPVTTPPAGSTPTPTNTGTNSAGMTEAQWAQGAIDAMWANITRPEIRRQALSISDPVARLEYLLSVSPEDSDQMPLYYDYLTAFPRPMEGGGTPPPSGGGTGGGTGNPPPGGGTGSPLPATPTSGDASVFEQLDRFTTRGGPMMTRARGIGAAVANQRGLQNSTLAGQAAQRAILDVAVPVASQEATLNQQRILSTQQTAAAERSAFAQALMAASASYSQNVAAIMSNPDLSSSARQAALSQASAARTADFNMVQRIYGVSLNWSSTSGSGTFGGSRPGGTGGA